MPASELESAVQDVPYSLQIKEQLVQAIFCPDNASEVLDPNAFSAYFAYYVRQCKEALAGKDVYAIRRKHLDITKVFDLLNSPNNKDAISKSLRRNSDGEADSIPAAVLDRTIELSARILVMHEMSTWQGVGQSRPMWDFQSSLGECLKRHYDKPCLLDSVKLERSFNIETIARIGGFEIIWTDDLSRHLSMHDLGDKQTLRIFHHATFLKAIRSGKRSTVLPHGLAAETLLTLALLFPHGDRNVKAWLHKERAKEEFELDNAMMQCGRLTGEQRSIEHFSFWKERLILLKQEFDAAEPATVYQWWVDKRKRVQWATFWVAVLVLVLTVFFGCIQSIEGALQVYKAYYPS